MAEQAKYIHAATSCSSRGLEVNYLNPRLDQISSADIAEGLSKVCRYSGQVPDKFYSVAEHSILCSYFVPEHLAMQALLHDSAEAYTSDIPSPIKQIIRGETDILDRIEDALTRVIFKKFSVDPYSDDDPISPEVHEADAYVFVQERNQIMPKAPWWRSYGGGDPNYEAIACHDWRKARQLFIRRFNELFYG